jgi:hypothetical protein
MLESLAMPGDDIDDCLQRNTQWKNRIGRERLEQRAVGIKVSDTPADEDDMCRYVYALHLDSEDGEIFFRFSGFPEIISAVERKTFDAMSDQEVLDYAHDAIITALQAIVATRDEIPKTDDPRLVVADKFVCLSVREAMKLELYKLYRANCKSVAEFARFLDKPETAVRRLLDLRHSSHSSELEKAINAFGKRLVHDWSLETA